MSNKEEKRRIREAKKQAAKRKEKMNSLLVKAVVFVMVPLIIYVLYQGLFTRAPIYSPDQISETDHVRGSDRSDLTIVIYADFQCPACFTETELIARAWPQIRDRVRIVFRNYPLDNHRHAFLAARYAEAAGKQGRFWEMHDYLYAYQQSWSVLNNATEVFDDYALQLGLDMDQLQADINSDEIRTKIIADQQGGTRAGVRSTPALFFNGRQVSNPRSVGELIEMVNNAIAEEV